MIAFKNTLIALILIGMVIGVLLLSGCAQKEQPTVSVMSFEHAQNFEVVTHGLYEKSF